jgi:hypothetical protein
MRIIKTTPHPISKALFVILFKKPEGVYFKKSKKLAFFLALSL